MHFYFSCAPLVTFKVSVCSAFFIFVNNSLCFASIIASWLHAKYHHRYERRSGEQKKNKNKVVGIKQRKFVKCQLVVYVYLRYGNSKNNSSDAMRSTFILSTLRAVPYGDIWQTNAHNVVDQWFTNSNLIPFGLFGQAIFSVSFSV